MKCKFLDEMHKADPFIDKSISKAIWGKKQCATSVVNGCYPCYSGTYGKYSPFQYKKDMQKPKLGMIGYIYNTYTYYKDKQLQ